MTESSIAGDGTHAPTTAERWESQKEAPEAKVIMPSKIIQQGGEERWVTEPLRFHGTAELYLYTNKHPGKEAGKRERRDLIFEGKIERQPLQTAAGD